MPERQPSSQQAARASRLTTYVVTNGTKVFGLYLIVAERAEPNPNDVVILVGAAFAMGASMVERILLAVIDRFFGVDGQR